MQRHRTRQLAALFVLSLDVVLGTACLGDVAEKEEPTEVRDISIEDLQSGQAEIIGRLGGPIGSVDTLSGVWEEEGPGPDSEMRPGLAFTVDRSYCGPVDPKVTFNSADIHLRAGIHPKPSGTRDTLVGFESIRYEGVSESVDEGTEAASRRRGFHTTLVLIRRPFADHKRELLQSAIEAKSAGLFELALSDLFKSSTAADLADYEKHADLELSLYAAWEALEQSARPATAAEVEEDKLPTDRPALEHYFDHLTKRLGVAPPDWWKAQVIAATALNQRPEGAQGPCTACHPPSAYKKGVDGLHVLATLNTELTPNRDLLITSGEKAFQIPARHIKAVRDINESDAELLSVTATVGEETCFFGIHGPFDGCTISRFDRGKETPIWSSVVESCAAVGLGGAAAADMQQVEIVRTGDTVVVFVWQSFGFCIEGISIRDGFQLFRFDSGGGLGSPL